MLHAWAIIFLILPWLLLVLWSFWFGPWIFLLACLFLVCHLLSLEVQCILLLLSWSCRSFIFDINIRFTLALWRTSSLVPLSTYEIFKIRLRNHISAASMFLTNSAVSMLHIHKRALTIYSIVEGGFWVSWTNYEDEDKAP